VVSECFISIGGERQYVPKNPKATVACISCQAAPRRTTCGGEVIEVWMMRRHAVSVLQSLIHEGRGWAGRPSKARPIRQDDEHQVCDGGV